MLRWLNDPQGRTDSERNRMSNRNAVGSLLVVGLLSFGTWWFALRPAPDVYPRSSSCCWLRGNGDPFVRAETTWVVDADTVYRLSVRTVIDTAKVYRLARASRVIIDPARVGRNADILRLLRAEQLRLDKRSTILALVKAGKFFVCGEGWVGGEIPYGCDTTGQNQSWSRWTVIRAHDAVLWAPPESMYVMSMSFGPEPDPAFEGHYARIGEKGAWIGEARELIVKPYRGGGWIDFARPGVAVALADSDAAWVPPGWSGIFADETPLRAASNDGSVDYRRSGFESYGAWDSAYRAGVEAYYARLRFRLGRGKLVVGNFGPHGLPIVNGMMVENVPHQAGGSVAEYLRRDSTLTKPTQNWLTHWGATERGTRYVIGMASLGEGVGVAPWSPSDPARGWNDVPDPWVPGSFGRANGKAYRDSVGAWVREFSNGTLTVDERALDAHFTRGR